MKRQVVLIAATAIGLLAWAKGWASEPAPAIASAEAARAALHQAMDQAMPPRLAGAFTVRTGDGMGMVIDRHGIVRRVVIGADELPAPEEKDFGGFWAWDISGPAKYYRFQAAGGRGKTLELRCEALGLRLKVRVKAGARAVFFDGELADERGQDRGVVLVWAMPLDAQGWRWGDDLLTERLIQQPMRYQNVVGYGQAGPNGGLEISPYPWAAVASEKMGLMICRPMDGPRLAAFFYDLAERQRFLGVRFYLGLSPAASKLKAKARFSFAVSRLTQPQWGFRAACARYYQMFPQFFEEGSGSREVYQLDLSEGRERGECEVSLVGAAAGTAEKRRAQGGQQPKRMVYSEPAVLRLKSQAQGADGQIDIGKFVRELQRQAAGPGREAARFPHWAAGRAAAGEIARAALNSYVGQEAAPVVRTGPEGIVVLDCNGDPEIGRPCRASLWFDYEAKKAMEEAQVGGVVVGGIEWGGFDMAEDLRREHWAVADLPLVASFQTGRCAQLAAFAHYELYAAIRNALKQRGKMLIGVGPALSHQFYAHLFDVIGISGATRGQAIGGLRRLAFCRALAYHKPVSQVSGRATGVVGDGAVQKQAMQPAASRSSSGQPGSPAASQAAKERALQQGLVYCVWPGGRSEDERHAGEADEKGTAGRYAAIFRVLARAGWEPIPYTYAWPKEVVVERYGQVASGVVYLVVHNSASRPVAAQVSVGAVASPLERRVTDMVTGKTARVRHGRIGIEMEAGQTAVFKIHTPQ